MQKQIYLHFAEAKYLRRSQNTKKPGQTQPESDFIQAKSKIVKAERKRELVPCFPRRILSSAKICKFGHTAESPYIGISITAAPIYYKYDIGIGASAIFNLLCSNHFIKSLNFCRLSLTHKPNAVLFPSRSTQ